MFLHGCVANSAIQWVVPSLLSFTQLAIQKLEDEACCHSIACVLLSACKYRDKNVLSAVTDCRCSMLLLDRFRLLAMVGYRVG